MGPKGPTACETVSSVFAEDPPPITNSLPSAGGIIPERDASGAPKRPGTM